MLPVNTRPARTGAIAIALAAPLPLFAQTGTAPTPVLPTVEVSETNPRDTQSYQGGTTRLGKLDQLPKDVPQGITIISDKLLFETNADTLKDAVRHVSGLTFNAGEGGRIGDNMTLRGF
ncbi:TonB-dependent receptor plug domain-containing protein, partial [Denitromonas sp.]|uniref:TonB-dependent receptor plug domain-containing protein n=1 Tax=Denitromonas sp. TaxID=2734609 RepID=UPI002FDD337A